jgi:hypothetical protein
MPPDLLLDIQRRLSATRDLLVDETVVGAGCFGDLKNLFRQQSAFTLLDCELPVTDGAGTYLTLKGRCDTLFPWVGNIAGSRNISLTLLDCPTKTRGTERHAALAISLVNPDLYPLLGRYSEQRSEDLDYLLAGIAARPGAGEPQVVFSSTDTASLKGELAEPLKNLANLFPGKTLQRGINFAADVTLGDDWLEYAGQILRQSGSGPGGYGVIYLKGEEKKPYLQFTYQLSGELEMMSGSSRILAMKAAEASFDVPLLPVWDDDEAGAEIFLGGRVALGKDAIGFDVTANVGARYGEVALAIKNFPSLSKLVELAGEAELKAYFPDLLAQLFDIQLSELALVLNISGGSPSVSQIRCALTTGELNLVPGVLSLRPSGAIRINAPFDAANRDIEGELKVDGKIGNTEVEGSIAFPSYAFHAGMKSGQSVSLLDIGKAIAPDLDLSQINFAQISLTELDLSGDLFGGSFAAQIGVDTEKAATFNLRGKPYGIKGMRLALQLDKRDQLEAGATDDDLPAGNAGADRQWVAGYQLEGYFLLRSTPIFISAQYDDAGWSLLGGTEGDQSLEVGSIIADLFPGLSVPPSLTQLKFANISFAAYLTAGEYSFSGRLEKWQPVQEIPLQFEVDDFSANYDNAGISGRLSVVLTIPLREGALKDIVIGLRAEKKPGEKGGWQFNGGARQEIKIGAMIDWVAEKFGAVSLPDLIKDCTIKQLDIAFNTESQNFKFTCEAAVRLPETKTEINGTVVIAIERQEDSSYKKILGGTLVIRLQQLQALNFDLWFATGSEAQMFLATYHGKQEVSIDDLLRQVFTERITTGVKLTIEDALFAYHGDKAGAKYLFGVKIGIDIGLAGLPLVGPALPKVGIHDLRILAATREFRLSEVNALNTLIPTGVAKLPSGKTDGGDTALPKGFNVSAKLNLAGADKLLMLPAAEAGAAPESSAPAESSTSPVTAPPATSAPAAKQSAGISKWWDVQKSLGPLRLQRLGVQYKEQRIGFLFDAGMDLLGVRLDLLGLSISLPLKSPLGDPKFELEGLELAIRQKPLEIAGALLKVTPPPTGVTFQYDGRVMVRAEVFSLAALGSYAEVNGNPSLFIFAVLHKELGGPAFFFVTGLAFGFGVNRLLKLPTIEEVHNFPLIKGATDPEYFGSAATPRTALAKLQEYIPPSVGDYWLAAGVKFNSFGMIESFAVLSVSFGTQFQIAILGLSKITVPRQLPGAPKVDPVACAELALKVSFTLSSGLLAAEARLTENSFVLSKDCKLRGGFALYCWLGPDHAGDFVVTLGGYHPKFTRPSHYPIVPRLGMNWKVGENLALCGELYFALTPACLMAGGKLSAAFQAGPVRAWFFASCDFLINWQPFAYDISMGIRIGVAFTLGSGDASQALTVEIGALLHMWGPPFGGIATINLQVISFDIAFGEPQQPVLEKVDWKAFHQSFLPQAPEANADPVLGSIRITAGLIKVQEVTRNGQKSKLNVVNAHELQFITESVVPATSVLVNNKSVERAGVAAKPVGIRPMDIKSLTSVHAVTLSPKASLPAGWNSHLAPSLTTKSVPEALWSDSGLARVERPSADMVDGTFNGASVALRHREPSHGLAPIELKKFEYDRFPKDIAWVEWQPPVPIPAPGDNTLANTIWGNDTVNQHRKAILKALGKDAARIDLSKLAEASTEIFQSEPDMARLGEPFKQLLYAG